MFVPVKINPPKFIFAFLNCNVTPVGIVLFASKVISEITIQTPGEALEIKESKSNKELTT